MSEVFLVVSPTGRDFRLRVKLTPEYDLTAVWHCSHERVLCDTAWRYNGLWRVALTVAGINLANASRGRPGHLDRETMPLWLRARRAAGELLIDTEVCLEQRDKALGIELNPGSWQWVIDEAAAGIESTDQGK